MATERRIGSRASIMPPSSARLTTAQLFCKRRVPVATSCGWKSSRYCDTTPSGGLSRNAAVDAVAAPLAASSAAMIGREFGPYQITSPLGAGGMGEVYRARDRKLGRDVAIKILPQEFNADPERRGRLAREARVLATLHHPHIAAIYGLEEVGD